MLDKKQYCNPLDYELFDYNFDYLNKVASEELSVMAEEVFFYGKIINADDWIINDEDNINEDSYYSHCPSCGKLFEIEDQPSTYDFAECPECGQEGTYYDFRDTQLPMENEFAQNYALLDTFEKGYVLRLFAVGINYADRDYENYEILSHTADIVILEVAREYWCEGKISCYKNTNLSIYETAEFEEVETIDDSEYCITNYENISDPMWSSFIGDNQLSDYDKPYLKCMTKGLSYRVFTTLKKYGFDSLLETLISVPCYYTDSSKITEILAVDYNQVKACVEIETFDIDDLLASRELVSYGLSITKINIEIMRRLINKDNPIYNQHNIRKLFKYLRNQISRTKSKSSVLAKDYIDYLNECKKLSYDMQSLAVLYPTDLPLAHRRTAAQIRIKNGPDVLSAVTAAYERYQHLCEWTDGKFAVIMPKSCTEIIDEGAAQDHCVGNYCERVAKGEDLILFIRNIDNLDKSFYTMEIRPDMKKLNQVQCRGYKNLSVEDVEEVNAFLVRYAKWFNKRPMEQPLQPLTRLYYKAVKKTNDGRYISAWDNKTEYMVGKAITTKMCENPDKVAVQGIHVASLEFAQRYGNSWKDVAILEIEVNLKDVVIPDAKDQIRTSRGKVLREVPLEEMGEWGKQRLTTNQLRQVG